MQRPGTEQALSKYIVAGKGNKEAHEPQTIHGPTEMMGRRLGPAPSDSRQGPVQLPSSLQESSYSPTKPAPGK